jgi:hypothetical protein
LSSSPPSLSITKASYLKLKKIPSAATAFKRKSLVAQNVVIEAENTRRRITAMLHNQATRRERAKLQVVWELEQAKIKTFEGAKGDLEQANRAYSQIEGPYGFTRPNFQFFENFKKFKTKQMEVTTHMSTNTTTRAPTRSHCLHTQSQVVLVSDLLRFMFGWVLLGQQFACFVHISDAFRLAVGSRSLTPQARLTHVDDVRTALKGALLFLPLVEHCVLLHLLVCLAFDNVMWATAWNRWMYSFEK